MLLSSLCTCGNTFLTTTRTHIHNHIIITLCTLVLALPHPNTFHFAFMSGFLEPTPFEKRGKVSLVLTWCWERDLLWWLYSLTQINRNSNLIYPNTRCSSFESSFEHFFATDSRLSILSVKPWFTYNKQVIQRSRRYPTGRRNDPV